MTKTAYIRVRSWRLADFVNDIGDNGSRPEHFSRHGPSGGNCEDTVRGAAISSFCDGLVSIDERMDQDIGKRSWRS